MAISSISLFNYQKTFAQILTCNPPCTGAWFYVPLIGSPPNEVPIFSLGGIFNPNSTCKLQYRFRYRTCEDGSTQIEIVGGFNLIGSCNWVRALLNPISNSSYTNPSIAWDLYNQLLLNAGTQLFPRVTNSYIIRRCTKFCIYDFSNPPVSENGGNPYCAILPVQCMNNYTCCITQIECYDGQPVLWSYYVGIPGCNNTPPTNCQVLNGVTPTNTSDCTNPCDYGGLEYNKDKRDETLTNSK